MDLKHSLLIEESARRGLRLQVLGVGIWLVLAFISIVGARTNPLTASLVVLSGIGIVTIGRGLRANGALLNLTAPPPPAWLAWLVPTTFIAGSVVAVIGVWLLLGLWRAAP